MVARASNCRVKGKASPDIDRVEGCANGLDYFARFAVADACAANGGLEGLAPANLDRDIFGAAIAGLGFGLGEGLVLQFAQLRGCLLNGRSIAGFKGAELPSQGEGCQARHTDHEPRGQPHRGPSWIEFYHRPSLRGCAVLGSVTELNSPRAALPLSAGLNQRLKPGGRIFGDSGRLVTDKIDFDQCEWTSDGATLPEGQAVRALLSRQHEKNPPWGRRVLLEVRNAGVWP